MAIKEWTIYEVVCDGEDCGEVFDTDDKYTEEEASAAATEGGWVNVGGNDYCPHCVTVQKVA